MERVTLIIGVIGDDIHIIGLKALEYYLKKEGFNLTSLGVLVSQEEFVKAALETDAKAILISSLNGHAEFNCVGLREKCVEAGLKDILLYIGGNLVVGHQRWEDIEKKFKEMGFDRVYPHGTSPRRAIEDLKSDLGLSSS
ncbi:MAG: methylaspartate mutase subunit S [Nitrososphaeria archaeon]|nr:methylaspartate mutase subunit S [Nitrososphaeria archaeon]NIN52179.1 methylaspartate mutase subunit S [Nitrososphaeria archaeon]NIQ32632.1 methylaspartate mutase subunit S [Nitrososphaeria archaeon]